jgi:hypothetical protein
MNVGVIQQGHGLVVNRRHLAKHGIAQARQDAAAGQNRAKGRRHAQAGVRFTNVKKIRSCSKYDLVSFYIHTDDFAISLHFVSMEAQ